ncbi:MAG: histidine phosphatase family protein, partial [Proteobacteria bacterium]|nr:histidine phosphatase family protein [Pseudomonadota bacterium]
MGSLFLIRHGQASYGEPDYDRLSTRGIAQARALGAHLASARLGPIYVGPHVRQRQTFEHAAATGSLPAAIELAGLAEYPAFQMLHHFVPRLVASDPHFAALETSPTPRLRDEAFRTILDRWSSDAWTADDVEPVGAFVARVRGALEQAIRASASGARIGLVT